MGVYVTHDFGNSTVAATNPTDPFYTASDNALALNGGIMSRGWYKKTFPLPVMDRYN